MRIPVVTLMIVIAIGFLATHAVMITLSIESWPTQVEEPRRTPDMRLGHAAATASEKRR